MEFSTPKLIEQGNNVFVSHGNDTGLFTEFSTELYQDEEETVKEGRPIFKEREIITIRFPGDNLKVVVKPVKYHDDAQGPSDLKRFPRQWEAFKNKTKVALNGTPLEEWPVLNKAMVMEFKSFNIHTIEDLANLPDVNMRGGWQQFKKKAALFLQQAKDGSAITRIEAENQSLKAEVESLKTQIAELGKVKRKKESLDGADTFAIGATGL